MMCKEVMSVHPRAVIHSAQVWTSGHAKCAESSQMSDHIKDIGRTPKIPTSSIEDTMSSDVAIMSRMP